MDQLLMILPENCACDFVFCRNNDGEFSFAVDIGVDEMTSHSHEAFLVEERIVGSESFKALFHVTPGVWSIDVFGL